MKYVLFMFLFLLSLSSTPQASTGLFDDLLYETPQQQEVVDYEAWFKAEERWLKQQIKDAKAKAKKQRFVSRDKRMAKVNMWQKRRKLLHKDPALYRAMKQQWQHDELVAQEKRRSDAALSSAYGSGYSSGHVNASANMHQPEESHRGGIVYDVKGNAYHDTGINLIPLD